MKEVKSPVVEVACVLYHADLKLVGICRSYPPGTGTKHTRCQVQIASQPRLQAHPWRVVAYKRNLLWAIYIVDTNHNKALVNC